MLWSLSFVICVCVVVACCVDCVCVCRCGRCWCCLRMVLLLFADVAVVCGPCCLCGRRCGVVVLIAFVLVVVADVVVSVRCVLLFADVDVVVCLSLLFVCCRCCLL